MRFDPTGLRIARSGNSDVLAWARAIGNRRRSARLDRAEVQARSAGPTIQERQRDLLTFYEDYEALVEVLCDAANYGPTPKLEAKYQRLRETVRPSYEAVRPFAVAYLRYSADDAAQGLAHRAPCRDAFEALFVAPDLEKFLQADDGSMISRIMRTREALNLYGEHVRQLLATAT